MDEKNSIKKYFIKTVVEKTILYIKPQNNLQANGGLKPFAGFLIATALRPWQ
jgi:hypothetical protein